SSMVEVSSLQDSDMISVTASATVTKTSWVNTDWFPHESDTVQVLINEYESTVSSAISSVKVTSPTVEQLSMKDSCGTFGIRAQTALTGESRTPSIIGPTLSITVSTCTPAVALPQTSV